MLNNVIRNHIKESNECRVYVVLETFEWAAEISISMNALMVSEGLSIIWLSELSVFYSVLHGVL